MAVFFVVIAGYMYMVGGDKGKETAKEILVSVLAGFLIMLSSYVLLRQINPTLVTFRTIQPPQLTGTYKIPSCSEVGLGTECLDPHGQVAVGDGNGGSTAVQNGGNAIQPIQGDGQSGGKKFLLMGDSLSIGLHRSLAALVTKSGGTMLTNRYEIGGSNVKNWAQGGGQFTKVADIIQRENPDVIIILLNTNSTSNYRQYIYDIASQTRGKIAYWIGSPNHYGCDVNFPKGGASPPDDNYIRAANSAAAGAFGGNYYDTYSKLPHLQIGGKTIKCNLHDLDRDRWAKGFWNTYYH
jgi:hypothetical protein